MSVRFKKTVEKTKPFVEKYGITSDEQLRIASIQWVLNNPDMHTLCVSFSSFDQIDKIIPVSGTKLSHVNSDFLKEYKRVFNNQYCRHGCNVCVERCPYDLPVNTIMRYAYYFKHQAREKYAMSKYRDMNGWNASHCAECSAPCIDACPHGLDVRAQLLNAHSILTFA
jgi:predicted aldo/keto reductase-like oxidoreductase